MREQMLGQLTQSIGELGASGGGGDDARGGRLNGILSKYSTDVLEWRVREHQGIP
jgi:hypothetical protein